ncbi:MAG TPA: transposase [candidate division Zixibacteria bacterium]|jgi:putative transposase
MPRRSYNIPGHAHLLTFSCFHKHQFLTDDKVRRHLADSIDLTRRLENFTLWAYVLMPDHVHLLVHPGSDVYSIPRILNRIKSPVAHHFVHEWKETAQQRLRLMLARQGKRVVHRLWQAGGGHDRNLTDWDAIANAMDYIEWNPVRLGLVAEPTDWTWSSARSRAGHSDVPLVIDIVAEAARLIDTELCKP